MKIDVIDQSETRKELQVTVPAQLVDEQDKEALKAFRKEARVPGFRAGKAPETILRQRFRKQLSEEINRRINQKVYEEAVQESDLDIYDVVEFPNDTVYTPGLETTLTITVDVTPPFDLPEYKNIATTVPSSDVTDAEIDEAIHQIRRSRADFKTVERAAEEGDYLQVSYKGTHDGEDIAAKLEATPNLKSWGTVDKAWEEAGTDEAKQYGVPAVIDGIVGMSADDEKEVTQTLPEDFAVEELRGMEITYAVTVHEVRERVLPEMDEAFLKTVRSESVEDFKAQIMDDLEGRKKQEADQAQRQQILDHLDGQVDIALPETGLERETQQVMGRVMVQNMQRGISEDVFEENKEALYAQSAQVAARDLKLQIILAKIAKEEDIKVADEDLSRAVYGIAQQQRRSPDEVVKELQGDRNRVIQLQRQILFQKTLDFLAKAATVAESTVEGQS